MRGAIGVSLGRGTWLAAVLILSLAVLGWAVRNVHAHDAAASPGSPDPQAERLTQALLDLSVQYQLGSAAGKPLLLGQLLSSAASRQQLLAQLVEDDPGEVLRVALPGRIRARLPSAVQAYVEREVVAEGTLEVLHEDAVSGSRYLYVLRTATERLALHFAGDAPELATGTRVRVHGVRVNGALALSSGTDSVQTLSLALPNTFGEQKTLVMLVNFADKATQPYTASQATSVVFNTTSSFDMENSYEQTWLTGDVVGWFTIPLSSAVCDYNTLASQAKSAAQAAGVTLSNYKRYVYGFPKNACTWWGLGTVGGSPSQAWINGTFSLAVVGHEMGHNLGLYHSHSLDCGAVVVGGTCTASEYGDGLDIMGGSSSAHFNAFQKERLGWLGYGASPPIATVQANGAYFLDPYETQSGTKALKILKSTDPSTGRKTWYYVERRTALGFDAYLSGSANVMNGVVLHLGTESSGSSSYLLDLTPQTSSWSDPGLDVGQSFSDPDAGVTITPVTADASGALVNVGFGPIACVRLDPTVAFSPSQSQWVPSGTPVSYTLSVTNNDNAGCATASFGLQAAVPAGWGGALGTSALTLAPGALGSTMFQVTSPVGTPDGFYAVGATATSSDDPSDAGAASGTYVVVASLTVGASTSKASYSRNQPVTVTATVSGNGAPVSGASVTFTITKANGTKVTGSATTGASGAASWSYRLKKTDPAGAYQAGAGATLNGLSGSGATSFTVQ